LKAFAGIKLRDLLTDQFVADGRDGFYSASDSPLRR
jgi:hypothetical protein